MSEDRIVDDYALSCVYGHLRNGQRDEAGDLDGAHALAVDTEPLLPRPVGLFCVESAALSSSLLSAVNFCFRFFLRRVPAAMLTWWMAGIVFVQELAKHPLLRLFSCADGVLKLGKGAEVICLSLEVDAGDIPVSSHLNAGTAACVVFCSFFLSEIFSMQVPSTKWQ